MIQLNKVVGAFLVAIGIVGFLAVLAAIFARPAPAQGQPDPVEPRDMGIIMFLLGLHAGALPYLDRAVRQHPNDAIAHLFKGHDLRCLGRRLEALRAFDLAVSLDASLYKSVPAMAKLAYKLGQPAVLPFLAKLWRAIDWIRARMHRLEGGA